MVAITTIVGDVVRQIAGDKVDLSILLPTGIDPHGYSPAPRDLTYVADARVIFVNGFGLEVFLSSMLESAGSDARIVSVSEGITALKPVEEHAAEEEQGHEEGDPHVWTDPNNVKIWVGNISDILVELDPANAAAYRANAEAYLGALDELDQWIRRQVALIPDEKRYLVTDHDNLAYFAQAYGFKLIGAVIPGISTLSETSAQELAAVEDAIRNTGTPVIFVSDNASATLPERVAMDTGIRVVRIHSGSLTGPEGNAPTYLEYIRYNVGVIVEALK